MVSEWEMRKRDPCAGLDGCEVIFAIRSQIDCGSVCLRGGPGPVYNGHPLCERFLLAVVYIRIIKLRPLQSTEFLSRTPSSLGRDWFQEGDLTQTILWMTVNQAPLQQQLTTAVGHLVHPWVSIRLTWWMRVWTCVGPTDVPRSTARWRMIYRCRHIFCASVLGTAGEGWSGSNPGEA